MHYFRKALMVTAGVAVGLFILNYATASFMPQARRWFGLA